MTRWLLVEEGEDQRNCIRSVSEDNPMKKGRRRRVPWPESLPQIIKKGAAEDFASALQGRLIGSLRLIKTDQGLGQVSVGFIGNQGLERVSALIRDCVRGL